MFMDRSLEEKNENNFIIREKMFRFYIKEFLKRCLLLNLRTKIINNINITDTSLIFGHSKCNILKSFSTSRLCSIKFDKTHIMSWE